MLPQWLNLDAFSILKLSCLILTTSFAAHLYSIRKKTRGARFGSMAFVGAALFCLAMFIEFVGNHYWQPRNLKNTTMPYIQVIGTSISMISLVFFAYHAPIFLRKHLKEARISVSGSICLNLFNILLCVYNFAFLEWRMGDVSFENTYFLVTYLIIAIQLFFVIFVLLRKASMLSSGDLTWSWRALFKARSFRARAARTYGLAFVLLVFVTAIFALAVNMAPVQKNYTVWLTTFIFFVVFLLVYLNYTRDPVKLQTKLVFYLLAVSLFVLSIVALLDGLKAESEYTESELVAP